MTTTTMTTPETGAQMLERVVVQGDLSKLSSAERLHYYRELCASVGLNPLTRPFQYLTLSGRLVLYATKDATDQLRDRHGVSITKLERESIEGVYCVTAHAVNGKGRSDSSLGAVGIEGLRGDAKANAFMKAETKAKRRVTLSLCGLGMLDETEIETVPSAAPAAVDHATGEILTPPATAPEETPDQEATRLFPDAPGPEDRHTLIGRIQGAAAKKKLSAEERRALWAQHVGTATPETADPAALTDLLNAIHAQ